jgi:4-amino-4-deoxy-L-arabinose transferase-like glycosyltransferase
LEPVEASDTTRNDASARSERLWIIAVGTIVVIQLWFGLIATSFWLDETGTWWIVKDGAAETVRRSFAWSGQSPLFYLVAWFSSRLFGLNEISLRIPSVLAASGAIWFLYRIAERLFDRASAVVAAFIFLCVVSFYAIDARPYALAILCLTVSTWALLRWLDKNRPMDAIIYVVAGALVVYAHCILSLGLGAGVIYAVVAARKQPRRLVWLGFFQVTVALLCLPLAPELATFYATRSAHTFAGPSAVGDLFAALTPGSLAAVLIFGLWIDMAGRKNAGIARRSSGLVVLLVALWVVFAPLVLFLLSVSTDLRLFIARYYSSSLPGQALLLGGLLSSIQRRAARKALIVAVGAVSILVQGRPTVKSHGQEDWKAAMALVRQEAGPAPVLLVSSFIEAADFKSLRNPKTRDILFAPELLYGEPVRSIRLPYTFAASETANLENVAEQLRNERRFYLLNNKLDRSYEFWLLGRFGSRCSAETTGPRFEYVKITRFTCASQR